MNRIIRYLLLLPLLFLGCSESQVEPPQIEVTIFGSPSTSTTRTALNSDLESTIWTPGDEIAVWAKGSGEDFYTLAAERFSMRYYTTTYTTAEFSATIPEMESDTYTYYGVYPYPVSVSGTQATFNLSATQSGEYDGVNDIMVATPTKSRELSSTTYLTPANMSFNHLMHIFRIEVPTEKDNFGYPLTSLEVTFPQNVVGSVTVDASDESASPTLSNGSSVITAEFDDSFELVDGNYIWLFVNPTTLSGAISFTGYAADGVLSYPIETTISKTLASGAITPISLTMPKAKLVTTLSVKLSADDVESRIGEPLESVTFTLPSGVTFDDGTSSVVMTPSDDDVYNLYLYNVEDFGTSFTAGSLTVRIDTDRVYKTDSVSLSSAEVNGSTSYSIDVPYFLKTSFENISSSEASTTGESHTTSIGGTGVDSGWVGSTRSTSTAGSHVTVRPYYYAYSSSLATYWTSKVSSCTLSSLGLKSTASNVSVYVSYDVTWTPNYHGSVTVVVGESYGGSIDDGMGESLESVTYTSTVENSKVTNAEITGLSSTSRIGWLGSGTYGSSNYGVFSGATSNYDNVHIDNVTITLVAE